MPFTSRPSGELLWQFRSGSMQELVSQPAPADSLRCCLMFVQVAVHLSIDASSKWQALMVLLIETFMPQPCWHGLLSRLCILHGRATAGGRVVASPYARKLAHEAGVDISQAQATGPGGRIVAADVQKLISSGGGKGAQPSAGAPPQVRCTAHGCRA